MVVTLGLRDVGLDDAVDPGLQAGLDAYCRATIGRTADVRLDARCFHDPDAGKLKRHVGTHPDIIDRLVQSDLFIEWVRKARCEVTKIADGRARAQRSGTHHDSSSVVLIFCRSGRHRAVAAAAVLERSLVACHGFIMLPVQHFSMDRSGGRGGCLCPSCQFPGSGDSAVAREAALQRAVQVWAAIDG